MDHRITPDHNQIRPEIVTTYEQLLHAYAIRSICFMEEHGVKAQQTFDGNDYQATHVIVYSGEEPIGTLRIRWFKDFAKFERTAFREAYRNVHILKACAQSLRSTMSPARASTRSSLTPSRNTPGCGGWASGSRTPKARSRCIFDGHAEPYIELVKDITPPENAIWPAPTRRCCSGPRATGTRLRNTKPPAYMKAAVDGARGNRDGECSRGLFPIASEAGGEHPPRHVRKAAVRGGLGCRSRARRTLPRTPGRPICRSPTDQRPLRVPSGGGRLNIFRKPASYLLGGLFEPEIVAEPWIVAAEDFGEPVEHETDRTGLQTLGQREQEQRHRNRRPSSSGTAQAP